MKEIWYLLYKNDSCDGNGSYKYVGRTKSMDEAELFLAKIRKLHPYVTGMVSVVDDKRERFM